MGHFHEKEIRRRKGLKGWLTVHYNIKISVAGLRKARGCREACQLIQKRMGVNHLHLYQAHGVHLRILFRSYARNDRVSERRHHVHMCAISRSQL